MKTIEDYDNTERVISSSYWREVLGLDGKSRDTDWAQFRRDIGMTRPVIVNGKEEQKANGYRLLTRREALLLLVRARWVSHIRSAIGKSKVKAKELTSKSIKIYANEWLAVAEETGHQDDIDLIMKAAVASSLTGEMLLEVICAIVGKRISEDTIRRWCQKENIQYRRKKKLPSSQIRRMIQVVYDRFPIARHS